MSGHRRTTEPVQVLHTRVMAGTGGGPEKTILRSPKYADASRYRLAAAYLHPADDPGIERVRARAEELGCPFYALPETGAIDPRPLPRLLELCRQLEVRIWHGHDYKSNLYGLLLRQVWPMRLVTTAHNWIDATRKLRLYRRVDEWCLPRYDHVIAVSSPLADECRQLGVTDDRLTMIPNAIEADQWQRRRSPAEAKWALGVPTEALVLGTAGRLNEEKRVDRLLRVAARLQSAGVGRICVLITGDGPERPALERLVQELDLAGSVWFCGWQSDPRPWYEAMDLFVLPSRIEGLPNAVLEAMAMRVPVAATDVGGVRDLLDGGACGVLLGQDETHWADRLLPLVRDADRRAALADAARQRIEQHFTFARRMQRVMAVYDRELAGESQAARCAA